MDDYFDLDAARMIWAMRIARGAGRAYLNGALIEPHDEGALIVATDGKVMLVQHDRKARAPRRVILRLTPPEPPARDEYDDDYPKDGWCWDGARVHIPAAVSDEAVAAPVYWHNSAPGTHMVAKEMAPAEKYPDWRKAWVSPRSSGDLTEDGGMQLHLLRALAGPENAIRLVMQGPGKPFVVSFQDDEDALGILMPCATPAHDDEMRADMLKRAGITAIVGAG